jgi:hypothetical protein
MTVPQEVPQASTTGTAASQRYFRKRFLLWCAHGGKRRNLRGIALHSGGVSDYPEQLDHWVRQHQVLLQTCGQVNYSKSPDDGRDKASASLTVQNESDEVELLLWDTGEAVFSYTPFRDDTMEHHDICSPVDLEQLLTRFEKFLLNLSAKYQA